MYEKPIPEDASRQGNGRSRAGQTRRFLPIGLEIEGGAPLHQGLGFPMDVCVAKKTLMRVVEGGDVVLGGCGNGLVARRGRACLEAFLSYG